MEKKIWHQIVITKDEILEKFGIDKSKDYFVHYNASNDRLEIEWDEDEKEN